MGDILSIIAGVVGVICYVYVLIKLSSTKGFLHGLVGFFIFLYPFIWGWLNTKELQLRDIMIVWSISFVVWWLAPSLIG